MWATRAASEDRASVQPEIDRYLLVENSERHFVNLRAKPAKLAFLIPYVGSWPKWSPLFFESCQTNPEVAVVVLCDAPPPFPVSSNVYVYRMERKEILSRLEKVTGLELNNITGHKLCDFKPFYGLAFAEFLGDYEFWGYCDIDMMFGDLRKLLTEDFYESVDAFSAHDQQFVGHFTILRNDPEVNQLCFQIDLWRDLCLSPLAEHVDEERFSSIFRNNPSYRWKKARSLRSELQSAFGRFGITFAYFGEIADLGFPDTPVVHWEDGSVYYSALDGEKTEVLYLHFMGLKRPWHWWLFWKRRHFGGPHYFSRIGYGGIREPSALHRFPWAQIYLVQTMLTLSKVKGAAFLRRVLPPHLFLWIRNRIRI